MFAYAMNNFVTRHSDTHRHDQQRHHIEQHKVNHVEQLGVEHLAIQHTDLLLLPVLGVNVLDGLAEDKFGR